MNPPLFFGIIWIFLIMSFNPEEFINSTIDDFRNWRLLNAIIKAVFILGSVIIFFWGVYGAAVGLRLLPSNPSPQPAAPITPCPTTTFENVTIDGADTGVEYHGPPKGEPCMDNIRMTNVKTPFDMHVSSST